MKRAVKSALEPISENKIQIENIEGSIDKEERNPACEEVIIVDDYHQDK